jgi:hypothetical protein
LMVMLFIKMILQAINNTGRYGFTQRSPQSCKDSLRFCENLAPLREA